MLIWGGIIYRVISYKKGNDYIPSNINQNEKTMVNDEFKDTFELKLNYRDPFLTSYQKNTIHKSKTERKKDTNYQIKESGKIETTRNIQSNHWPEIIYSGYIENDDKLTAIIKVDNTKYLVKMNEVISGLKILSISKEVLKIKWKNEIKSISKI